MGEALKFILQRFYFSLGSGCIINFYVLCVLFFHEKVAFLRKEILLLGDIHLSILVSILIFIFSALIIGLFIEGFYEIGSQYYQVNYRKLFIPKQEKNGIKTFYEYLKVKLIFLAFMTPTTYLACEYFFKQMQDNGKNMFHNKDFEFMYDPNTDKLLTDPGEVFSIMQKYSLKISQKLKSEKLYRHRYLSFIAQLMRFSLLFISLVAFILTICFARCSGINWYSDDRISSFAFYLICFGASTLLVIFTTFIASGFSKRYVREVGKWYYALEYHEKRRKGNSDQIRAMCEK